MPKFFLSTFLSLIVGVTYAQYMQNARPGYGISMEQPAQTYDTTTEKKKFDPNRLVFGGNLAVSFGDFTFINISPQVGYRFTPFFTGGAGINYINSSVKVRDINGNDLYKESYGYAGMNLFGRVFPTNFLFAMLQPEINYSWGKINYTSSSIPDSKLDTKWVPTLLVGAGVMMGGLMLSIQYDLAQDPRSPYGSNAFVGMGYAF